MNSPKNEPNTIETKVVLMGDSGVVYRFVQGKYDDKPMSTIGASFMTKRLTHGKWTIKLQIWDTAGEEKFKSMLPMYYRGAGVAILVYDTTNERTFDSVKYWVSELSKNVKDGSYIIVIAGNKSDLEQERKIPTKKAKEFAQEIGALFFETSAKNDEGLKEMFDGIVDHLLSKDQVPSIEENDTRIVHMKLASKDPSSPKPGCPC